MPGVDPTVVDVIVATYGQPDLLRNCLISLRKMTYRNYRLIVVDDGSPVPALPVVEAQHPGALVLRARTNVGLVRAMNKGIQAGNAPLVALLNDDTEVTPDWLGELVDAAERRSSAGSFASKILLIEDPPRFHTAGDGFGVWGMPYNRGVWLDDLGQYDSEEEVFGACAGAALYRRAALESVRLGSGIYFAPAYFMYLEDVDISWRLQRSGYRCTYVPSAIVRHHLSASGGGRLASYQVSRNIWRILFTSMPRTLLKKHWKSILTHHLGRNYRHVKAIRSAEARASLRGTVAGIASLFPLLFGDGKGEDAYSGFPLTESIEYSYRTPRV